MASVKSAFIFPDGPVMVFDSQGQQMPELQQDFIVLLLEFWEGKGYHPNEFGEINVQHAGKGYRLIPYKTEGKWNYEIVEYNKLP